VIALYSNNASRQSLHSAKVSVGDGVVTSRPPLQLQPLPKPVVVEARPLSFNELFIGWQVRPNDKL